MIIIVSVSMFGHKPDCCPFGYPAWRKSDGNPASARRPMKPPSAAEAWGTSGCHVTPVTSNFGRRCSTSRRMTSTITNRVSGERVQLPGMPLFDA